MLIWKRQPVQAGGFTDEVTGPEVEWQPALDIYETTDEYLLVLSVPGVRPDDVEAVVAGGTLVVSGRRALPLPVDAAAHLIEAPRGYFERRIRLPGSSDLTALRTELEYGELVIHVPKAKQPPIRIRVRAI